VDPSLLADESSTLLIRASDPAVVSFSFQGKQYRLALTDVDQGPPTGLGNAIPLEDGWLLTADHLLPDPGAASRVWLQAESGPDTIEYMGSSLLLRLAGETRFVEEIKRGPESSAASFPPREWRERWMRRDRAGEIHLDWALLRIEPPEALAAPPLPILPKSAPKPGEAVTVVAKYLDPVAARLFDVEIDGLVESLDLPYHPSELFRIRLLESTPPRWTFQGMSGGAVLHRRRVVGVLVGASTRAGCRQGDSHQPSLYAVPVPPLPASDGSPTAIARRDRGISLFSSTGFGVAGLSPTLLKPIQR